MGDARKVLFVYRVCGLGGIETSLVNRLKALDRTGFEGHTLFGKYYGSKGASLARSLRASVGLGRADTVALLRDGFHAIVVIDDPDFMNFIDEARPSCPVIAETHASFTPALSRLYRRFDHPRLSAVIVPSEFNKRLVEQHAPVRTEIVVIPNAVDETVFRQGGPPTPVPQLGDESEGPVVLWVGRLEDEKNPVEFASLAVRIAKTHRGLRFVVVGDSYDEEEYSEQRRQVSQAASGIAAELTFLRGVPYEEMPNLYRLTARSGGCLVSTSLFESVPMTFIEAMACGCPVVSTDVGGVRELIVGGETGYLYRQGDLEAACSVVEDLVAGGTSTQREMLVASGSAHVATKHSLAGVGAMYQSFFNALPSKAPPAGSRPRAAVPEPRDGDAGPVTVPGLVSTIIPVYNRAGLLREAVQSVLDQTYDDIEVIIVDDGSTDDTVGVCDELARDHPEIRVLHVPHRGRPGLAREAGRLVARGEYIQYLDSDDVLASNKFATMVSVLTAHPECDVAYCPTRRYRIGGPVPDHPWGLTGQSFGTMLPACVSRRLWLTPTPLYRRSLCDAVGPWSDLSLWEDIEYDMRIATQCRGLYHCAEMLVDVRDHDQGRLSEVDFFSDPARMEELARAVRMVYESVKRCDLRHDEEHVDWFLDDVRLIRRRCLELKLEAAAEECTRLLLEATGSDEPEQADPVSIQARIQPPVAVLRAPPGVAAHCPVIVRNDSRIAFRTGNEFAFQLSSRVLSIDRTLVQPQSNLTLFEPPLRPGEERQLDLWIEAPDVCGVYLAEIDILRSPATWLGSLGSPTATIKLVVTNLIKKHQWRLQVTEDNEARVAFPGGHVESIRWDITRATTSVPWHIQLNQDALKLAAKQRCVLRFEGRAESSREVGVGVSMAHAPWQGLGMYRRVELGPDWKSFELDFTVPADDDNARLHFDAGGSEVGIELRKVSITDATRGVQIEPPPLSYLARHQMDLGVKPVSEWWGTDRGLAIHRYYLESFLAEFAGDVRGRCLEFQDPQYTPRFGGAAVTALDILHIDDSNPEATLVADLTQPNTLPSDAFDCVLCSHVLHVIFEVEKAVRDIHRILKPGGVLLVAVPHISMYGPEFGEIWRFTPEGLRILLSRVFGPEHVTWRAYGNSLTAAGEIRGLASHEFSRDELDSHDMRFAVEVCARAVKQA